MKKNNSINIEKCMEPVDMTDYYITKNILKIISKKKNFDFLKNNIFLLAINNKNNKNSLIILLENGKYKFVEKLILYDYQILNFKNIHENNLFKSLLLYHYFYDLILKSIIDLDRKFVIKIITDANKQGYNFIDNLIQLINSNHKYYDFNNNSKSEMLKKLIKIAHNIYLLDAEKYTLIITKLCKVISNQGYLYEILKYFQIDNFDIYPDKHLFLCIDYLILNEYFDVLKYLIDKVNYIEFTNIDDNLIFKLCENNTIDLVTKTDVLIKILYKSNIAKFKNNKNQSIFFWLIENYDIDISTLKKFIEYINIYEQDIYGKTLFDLIKLKYNSMEINNIKKYFVSQSMDNNTYEKINKKIKIKNKLVKSDIGVFTSNIIHNMIYTIYILNNNKNILSLPYYIINYDEKDKLNQQMEISNNEKSLISYIKLFFSNFNNYFPHLIIWKNKYNYWIDPNLIKILNSSKFKSKNFIHIKLSVYLINEQPVRHSNVIIVDNVNKIVERFEPYGEIIFTNSIDINNMITTQIANPLGYKFIFTQPYPGFQSRSDEFSKFNKNYGDPMGFCLAWSFLYIEIRMELFKKKINANPIDFINWYIINKFSADFDIDLNMNKSNKYILFIRYYARFLDLEKNKIIKKIGLDSSLIYQNELDTDYQNKLIDGINSELNLLCL